jgi:hypothetical protein
MTYRPSAATRPRCAGFDHCHQANTRICRPDLEVDLSKEDSMPRSHMPKLRPNAEWPAIIGDILGSDAKAHETARSTMWLEVTCYIEGIATLPSGFFNDDEEARRDIAVRVLRRLEARSYFHLKEWLARQLRKQDHVSWWAWINTISRCISIDYGRIMGRGDAAVVELMDGDDEPRARGSQATRQW